MYYTSFKSLKEQQVKSVPQHATCGATTKSGGSCRRHPKQGETRCWQHQTKKETKSMVSLNPENGKFPFVPSQSILFREWELKTIVPVNEDEKNRQIELCWMEKAQEERSKIKTWEEIQEERRIKEEEKKAHEERKLKAKLDRANKLWAQYWAAKKAANKAKAAYNRSPIGRGGRLLWEVVVTSERASALYEIATLAFLAYDAMCEEVGSYENFRNVA